MRGTWPAITGGDTWNIGRLEGQRLSASGWQPARKWIPPSHHHKQLALANALNSLEVDSSQSLCRRVLNFGLWDPKQRNQPSPPISNLQNCETTHLCCFRSLSWWSLVRTPQETNSGPLSLLYSGTVPEAFCLDSWHFMTSTSQLFVVIVCFMNRFSLYGLGSNSKQWCWAPHQQVHCVFLPI